jgi:hypothetical protein
MLNGTGDLGNRWENNSERGVSCDNMDWFRIRFSLFWWHSNILLRSLRDCWVVSLSPSYSVPYRTERFKNWNRFHPQLKGCRGSCSVESVRIRLSHSSNWDQLCGSTTSPSPENGNRSSFRNIVSFKNIGQWISTGTHSKIQYNVIRILKKSQFILKSGYISHFQRKGYQEIPILLGP